MSFKLPPNVTVNGPQFVAEWIMRIREYCTARRIPMTIRLRTWDLRDDVHPLKATLADIRYTTFIGELADAVYIKYNGEKIYLKRRNSEIDEP